jgi:hypothetical protein
MELQFTEKQISTMAKARHSTQYVIEILNMHSFDDIRQSGYMYYCNRPGSKEITFRETFGGNHVFYVGTEHCHSVYQAIKMAGVE